MKRIQSSNGFTLVEMSVVIMPTVKSLTGATLSIRVNATPPVINNGSCGAYDPSGSTKDSLWDVGQ